MCNEEFLVEIDDICNKHVIDKDYILKITKSSMPIIGKFGGVDWLVRLLDSLVGLYNYKVVSLIKFLETLQ